MTELTTLTILHIFLQISNSLSEVTEQINQLVAGNVYLFLLTYGQLKKVQLPAQHGIAMF